MANPRDGRPLSLIVADLRVALATRKLAKMLRRYGTDDDRTEKADMRRRNAVGFRERLAERLVEEDQERRQRELFRGR